MGDPDTLHSPKGQPQPSSTVLSQSSSRPLPQISATGALLAWQVIMPLTQVLVPAAQIPGCPVPQAEPDQVGELLVRDVDGAVGCIAADLHEQVQHPLFGGELGDLRKPLEQHPLLERDCVDQADYERRVLA